MLWPAVMVPSEAIVPARLMDPAADAVRREVLGPVLVLRMLPVSEIRVSAPPEPYRPVPPRIGLRSMVPRLRSVRSPPTARSVSVVKSLASPSVTVPPPKSDRLVLCRLAPVPWLIVVPALSAMVSAVSVVPAFCVIAPPFDVRFR